MRIHAHNQSFLMSTFAGAGRGSSPEGESVAELHVPPVIMPVAELCVPFPRLATGVGVNDVQQQSQSNYLSLAVAAGGGTNAGRILTLARGIWRLALALQDSTIGGVNAAAVGISSAISLVDPSLGFDRSLLALVTGGAASERAGIFLDGTFHLPVDGYFLQLNVFNPVTAATTVRAVGSVYACRLL